MRHFDRYEVVMGSMTAAVGMCLELWDCVPPGWELVLWAFYSDADGSFEFERHRADVPPDVEAWFRAEARRRLPPCPDA